MSEVDRKMLSSCEESSSSSGFDHNVPYLRTEKGIVVRPFEIIDKSSIKETVDIYLIHRGPDTKKEIVEPLAFVLKGFGVKRFADTCHESYSMPLGKGNNDSMKQCLSSCKYAALLVSKDFLSSEHCVKEVNTILLRERRENRHILLPFFYCNSCVDPLFEALRSRSALVRSSESAEGFARKMAEEILITLDHDHSSSEELIFQIREKFFLYKQSLTHQEPDSSEYFDDDLFAQREKHKARDDRIVSSHKGSGGEGEPWKTAQDDSSIDVYMAVQAPSSVLDNIYERPHLVLELRRIEKQMQGTLPSMREIQENLRCIHLTDGMQREAEIAFSQASTVRLFVWCAEGINELATEGNKDISMDFLGRLFKKHTVPEVVIVCMKYGSQLVGEKIRALGVQKVVSISTDPFGNDCSRLVMTCVRFGSGLLAGDYADDDPFERLKGDVSELDPHCKLCQFPGESEIPCLSQGVCSTTPKVVRNVRRSCSADWCSAKELKKLELNLADLPLLDRIRAYICENTGESRYVQLKPYPDDDREKAGTSDRVRALALHVCNEIAQNCSIRFEGGVHRVSSKEEADDLQSEFRGTYGTLLVWIDLMDKQPLPFRSGKDWIYGFGEDTTVAILITSVVQRCDEVMEGLVGNDIELEEPFYVDISQVRSNGVLSLRPCERGRGSNTCILDMLRTPSEIEGALQTVISNQVVDEDYSEGFRRFSGFKVYRDDDKSTKICLSIGDLTLLRVLLDLVFLGEGARMFANKISLDTDAIQFDCSDFASCFENIIMQLETPTSYQRQRLLEIKNEKYVRIEGGAGTGKTFLALHSSITYLQERKESGKILFVCKNPALAFHFSKWLYRRFKESDTALRQVFLLCQGMKEPQGIKRDSKKQVLEAIEISENQQITFGEIVIDEAHEVFRHNEESIDDDFRRIVTKILQQANRGDDFRLMLLSDISQASVPEHEIQYPYADKLTTVELNSVCRNTERVTAGALSYRLGATEQVSCAHKSKGLKIRTYFFQSEGLENVKKFHLYVQKIIDALQGILDKFTGLDLHDHVSIIVPNERFRKQLVNVGLKDKLEKELGQRLILKRADEASRALHQRNQIAVSIESWIILDTVSAMDGLERLLVLCVGLDRDIDNDISKRKDACAQIYRAMTRPHLFVALINERISGGFFEWMSHLDDAVEEFSLDKFKKTLNAAAMRMMTTLESNRFPQNAKVPSNDMATLKDVETSNDTASNGDTTTWKDASSFIDTARQEGANKDSRTRDTRWELELKPNRGDTSSLMGKERYQQNNFDFRVPNLAMIDASGNDESPRSEKIVKFSPVRLTAETYARLGDSLYRKCDYNGAFVEHRKALRVCETLLGKEHSETAKSHYNIGLALHEQGNYKVALEEFREALAIRETVLGQEHPDTAKSHNSVGSLLYELGDYDESLKEHCRALQITSSCHGLNVATATTCNSIGQVYSAQGDHHRALTEFRRALEICRTSMGTEHQDVTAESHNNVGAALHAQGDYRGALAEHNKARRIRKTVLGKNHPDTADSYDNIGLALHRQHQYNYALAKLRKGLFIRETVLGKEHPDTATSYKHIGDVLYSQRQYLRALEEYRKALAVREKVLGREHPHTAISYFNIGLVLHSQGQYDDALEAQELAFDVFKKVLGKDHPHTTRARNNIARTIRANGGKTFRKWIT